jgi:hypothetical protein
MSRRRFRNNLKTKPQGAAIGLVQSSISKSSASFDKEGDFNPGSLGLRPSTGAATTRRGPAGRGTVARIADEHDQGFRRILR